MAGLDVELRVIPPLHALPLIYMHSTVTCYITSAFCSLLLLCFRYAFNSEYLYFMTIAYCCNLFVLSDQSLNYLYYKYLMFGIH